MSVSVFALDKDIEVDLLMSKITTAIKTDKTADALPSFAKLESMEPSLGKPLPENFHFFYIDALDKSGDYTKALSRCNIYLEKFGKKGKHYGQVIEIMSRSQDRVEREAKAAAERKAREEQDRKDTYDRKKRECAKLNEKVQEAYINAGKVRSFDNPWQDRFTTLTREFDSKGCE